MERYIFPSQTNAQLATNEISAAMADRQAHTISRFMDEVEFHAPLDDDIKRIINEFGGKLDTEDESDDDST